MLRMPILCSYYHSDQVANRGKAETGKQRSRYHTAAWISQSFLDSTDKGRVPAIKQ